MNKKLSMWQRDYLRVLAQKGRPQARRSVARPNETEKALMRRGLVAYGEGVLFLTEDGRQTLKDLFGPEVEMHPSQRPGAMPEPMLGVRPHRVSQPTIEATKGFDILLPDTEDEMFVRLDDDGNLVIHSDRPLFIRPISHNSFRLMVEEG
jgi:hypothetical protein